MPAPNSTKSTNLPAHCFRGLPATALKIFKASFRIWVLKVALPLSVRILRSFSSPLNRPGAWPGVSALNGASQTKSCVPELPALAMTRFKLRPCESSARRISMPTLKAKRLSSTIKLTSTDAFLFPKTSTSYSSTTTGTSSTPTVLIPFSCATLRRSSTAMPTTCKALTMNPRCVMRVAR